MDWTDEGVVLGTRRHGEGSVILEVMTRAHGRHLGLVRGGGGARLRAVLQPGNSVRAVWRARSTALGHYIGRGLRLRRRRFSPCLTRLWGDASAALCRLLPERDPILACMMRSRRSSNRWWMRPLPCALCSSS